MRWYYSLRDSGCYVLDRGSILELHSSSNLSIFYRNVPDREDDRPLYGFVTALSLCAKIERGQSNEKTVDAQRRHVYEVVAVLLVLQLNKFRGCHTGFGLY